MPRDTSISAGSVKASGSIFEDKKLGSCYPCRRRKIKCPGERPVCSRCTSRCDDCAYDEKRIMRGKDKQPRHRRLRERNPIESVQSVQLQVVSRGTPQPNSGDSSMLPPIAKTFEQNPMSNLAAVCLSPNSSAHDTGSTAPLTLSEIPQDLGNDSTLSRGPSIAYYRSSWFDTLLDSYSDSEEQSLRLMSSDLSVFFKSVHHLFTFIHIPTFVSRIAHKHTRERMQPSLILSMLAFSYLVRFKSQTDSPLMERSLFLSRWAHSAMEASVATGWFTVELVEAAAIISMFHFTPHPLQSETSATEAAGRLDVLIRALKLCQMDAGIPQVSHICSMPSAHTLVRSLENIPVSRSTELQMEYINLTRSLSVEPIEPNEWTHQFLPAGPRISNPEIGSNRTSIDCLCREASYGTSIRHDSAVWVSEESLDSPGWELMWSDSDIAREEARRVVWASSAMFSKWASYKDTVHHRGSKYLLSTGPQFCVLFPGEILHISRGDYTSGKNSVWALNCRVHLLWHACQQVDNTNTPSENRDAFANDIQRELERLAVAFSTHHCGVETNRVAASRFFLYSVSCKMSATNRIRRGRARPVAGFFKHPQHSEAASWIRLLKSFASDMRTPQHIEAVVKSFSWNPWLLWGLVCQLSRCLELWELDHNFIIALKLARQIHSTLTRALHLFPSSPYIEGLREEFGTRLARALEVAGLPSSDFWLQGINFPE